MNTVPLPLRRPTTPGILPPGANGEVPRLNRQDPAILAVTDFSQECPVTTDEDRPIDDALNDMVRLGVRALVVVNDRGVIGLVTSYDIQGEGPMQFLLAANYSSHRDITVGHIMTPWDHLTSVNWQDLHNASIGQLSDVFAHTPITHLVVLERPVDGAPSIMRGLISRTRIARHLGGHREPSERPPSLSRQSGAAGLATARFPSQ